jgi:hypothetical protein
VFSRIFVAEEVEGVGDKGSGDTTMADVQTLLEAFLNMLLRSAFSLMKVFFFFFSGKKKNVQSREYCPQVLDYEDFQIIGCWIKGILLY